MILHMFGMQSLVVQQAVVSLWSCVQAFPMARRCWFTVGAYQSTFRDIMLCPSHEQVQESLLLCVMLSSTCAYGKQTCGNTSLFNQLAASHLKGCCSPWLQRGGGLQFYVVNLHV